MAVTMVIVMKMDYGGYEGGDDHSDDLLSAYYVPVTGLNALFFWILEALWNINCYIILILHLRELGAHRVAVTHLRSHI